MRALGELEEKFCPHRPEASSFLLMARLRHGFKYFSTGCAAGSALVGSAVLALLGCSAELASENANRLEDERSMPLENPPMIREEQVVPKKLETLPSEETCIALDEGERLLGVDPNGIAWLAKPVNGVHELRAFDFRDELPGAAIQLELEVIVAAQFLGGRAAAFLGPDALWSFDDGSLTQQALGVDRPSDLCGDPESNGAVLAAGHFSERRGDQWWAWDPAVPEEEALVRLIDVDGDCYDRNDGAWMLGANGRLWRVSSADTQLLFSDVLSVDATAASTAVLTADSFYFGRDDWQHWTFPGPAPSRVVAGAEVMWLEEAGGLLRFDGSEFKRLEHSLSGQVETLHGHAGGIWLQADQQLCHYETQETLRIEGIRPGQRTEQATWIADVQVSDSPDALEAWLNGGALDVGAEDANGILRVEVADAALGWNEMRLVQGTAERALFFRREPAVVRSWEADIEAISTAACLDCHAPGGDAEKSPLETYDQWVASAAKIRKRVIQTETMPPLPAPGWEKEMQVIAEWLEGGMNP